MNCCWCVYLHHYPHPNIWSLHPRYEFFRWSWLEIIFVFIIFQQGMAKNTLLPSYRHPRLYLNPDWRIAVCGPQAVLRALLQPMRGQRCSGSRLSPSHLCCCLPPNSLFATDRTFMLKISRWWVGVWIRHLAYCFLPLNALLKKAQAPLSSIMVRARIWH